ncbi:MAG: HD domain-containing protein [Polyangiaceae bacterium]|nr:HD domain-containing protein [Polyangiaceae bacterium]
MPSHSPSEARALLLELGAPHRLLRHVELVAEAADLLLGGLRRLHVPVDANLVLAGVVLHDAGKLRYPDELDRPGAQHEAAGRELLLEHGVSPALARICVSHASWDEPGTSFEELLVALSDKLWKGVRNPGLEERVIDCAANLLGRTRWDLFVQLDSLFEQIASAGSDRLSRSRC